MFETLLSKIGISNLISMLSSSLKNVDNSSAQTALNALEQLVKLIDDGEIDQDQIAEANRHIEQLASIESEKIRAALQAVNQSLRAEIASTDKYISRMRPTFGYIMAFTWAAQMLGIAYVIITNPLQAGALINAMSALSAIWGVALSVLGVYVYKRSEDKKYTSLPPETIIWNK